MTKVFSKNILKHELRQYWKGILGWTIGLTATAAMFLSLYPSLVEQTTIFKDLLESFPPEFQKLFGINQLTVTSLIGYFGFTFTYITLLGAVQAMSLGISVFAKEISGKTSDFLMTKPISRIQIFTSKALAATSLVALLNIAFSLITFVITRLTFDNPLRTRTYILITLSLFFVQLFFLCLGFLTGIWIKKIKTVIALSLPTALGFYIVGMMDSLIGREGIKYFTPFRFFDYEYIDTNLSYEWQFVLLEIVLVCAFLYIARRIYLTRDVHAV